MKSRGAYTTQIFRGALATTQMPRHDQDFVNDEFVTKYFTIIFGNVFMSIANFLIVMNGNCFQIIVKFTWHY